MTSSLTSYGSVNDITQHFPLNSFLVLSFDAIMYQLRSRWKTLKANQCYGNLLFVSINVSLRETVPLRTFPWIFPHPNFIKNTITFNVWNDVNVRFVHRVLKVHPTFQVLLQFLYPQFHHQVLLNFFGECSFRNYRLNPRSNPWWLSDKSLNYVNIKLALQEYKTNLCHFIHSTFIIRILNKISQIKFHWKCWPC